MFSKYGLYAFTFTCFALNATWANDIHALEHNNMKLNEKKISAFAAALVQETITGQVVDENGVGLPGASVVEQGTANGTSTDFDGNYSITVDEGSILEFSYIGYETQEVAVGSSSTINVQMVLDASQLDEVVVLGYGTQIKAKVTNAVAQVSGTTINKSPVVSTANSLAGRMAGVFVTQNSSAPGDDNARIRVRGSNTYRNSNALIVIDGVANVDGIDRLDPNDIEDRNSIKRCLRSHLRGAIGRWRGVDYH